MNRSALVLALLGAVAVCAVPAALAAGQDAAGRSLLQGDPFTQFNEAPAPGVVAADAPSVNTAGVPAVSSSATTVPVFAGGLPSAGYAGYPAQAAPAQAQDPYAAYAAQQQAYAAQPTAAAAAYAPQTAYAAQPTAAAAAYPTATTAAAYPTAAAAAVPAAVPAAAAPVAAAPVPEAPAPALEPEPEPEPVPEPAPAPKPAAKPAPKATPSPSPPPPPVASPPPPPPFPAGMVSRADITNQIPTADAAKMPKIKVPEGTTQKFTWVCDANGMLYIGVYGTDRLIQCPTANSVNLEKTLGIKGAAPLACPDNRKSCPGNKAVQLVVNLLDKLEVLEANQEGWKTTIAKAASVTPEQVVIVDVKLHYDREKEQAAAKAAAAKAAAAPAADANATAADANATAPLALPEEPAKAAAGNDTAKPAADKLTAPKTAPLRRLMRLLLADPAPAADAPAPPKKDDKKPAKVEDTMAVVEEVPKGPKPNITVFTSIQPLTQADAESVLGTLGSPYFDATFRSGLKAMKMTMTDDYTKAIVQPDKAYQFPKPEEPLPPPKKEQIPINDTTGLLEPGSNATVVPVPAGDVNATDANATAPSPSPAPSSASSTVVSLGASLVAALVAAAFL